MKTLKKFTFPLTIFVITILVILGALFIKYFYVNSVVGKERLDNVLLSFSLFSIVTIATLSLDVIRRCNRNLIIRIINVIIIPVNIYFAIMFIHVYHQNIDTIINKLLYISTIKTVDILNPYITNNDLMTVVNILAASLFVASVVLVIAIIKKPIITKVTVVVKKVFTHFDKTVNIIIEQISKGFLYKRVP